MRDATQHPLSLNLFISSCSFPWEPSISSKFIKLRLIDFNKKLYFTYIAFDLCRNAY